MNFRKLLTYFPGFAFPVSYILSIMIMILHDTASGANPWSYFMYYLANLAAFLFIGKYNDIRTIVAFLLTGFLEFLAVFFALHFNESISNTEKIIVYCVSFISLFVVFYMIRFHKKFIKSISSIAGYLPAIIFPLGTWFMYSSIKDTPNPQGVSLIAWILQFLGNFGGYFFRPIGKEKSPWDCLSGSLISFSSIGFIS